MMEPKKQKHLKENQCFGAKTLKTLRKTYIFGQKAKTLRKTNVFEQNSKNLKENKKKQ